MATPLWHNRHNLEYRVKTKFRGKLKRLLVKSPEMQPYSLTDAVLAKNWWGKAWNAYLKNYAANTNRLDKGRMYFKCDALADLKIKDGHISAVVLGSKPQPYTVEITIDPISEIKWGKIKKKCCCRCPLVATCRLALHRFRF